MAIKTYPWHLGFPSNIGWYLTAIMNEEETTQHWRWFDGLQWSFACKPEYSLSLIAEYAQKYTVFTSCEFVWCEFWPKNARVPRINPEA